MLVVFKHPIMILINLYKKKSGVSELALEVEVEHSDKDHGEDV